jgi:hypothetical protein
MPHIARQTRHDVVGSATGCCIEQHLARPIEASSGSVTPNHPKVGWPIGYVDLDITLSDGEGRGERSPSRRSERSGLSRRSPGEPRRSRLFCTPAPGLGVYRRRLRTGSVRSDCCPSRAIGKDRCCVGPFRLALQKEPPDVCPVSRIGPPCGNLHRAGLTGRPLAGVPSDLGCSACGSVNETHRQPAVPPPGPKCGSAH